MKSSIFHTLLKVFIGFALIYLMIGVFLSSLLGMLSIIEPASKTPEGTNLFLSFIALGLALSILCFTIKQEGDKEYYKNVGSIFALSSILLFLVYITAVSNTWPPRNLQLKILYILLLLAFMYATITFVLSLISLTLVLSGLITPKSFMEKKKSIQRALSNLYRLLKPI